MHTHLLSWVLPNFFFTDLRISNGRNFQRPQSPLFFQSPFYKGGQRGIKGEKKDFPLLTRNSIIPKSSVKKIVTEEGMVFTGFSSGRGENLYSMEVKNRYN